MLEHIARKLNFNRRLSLFAAAWIAVAMLALGQGRAAPSGRGIQISDAAAKAPKPVPANADPAFDVATIKPGESGTKQWKFAVVSIRKNNSGGPQHIGVVTADGYQMKDLFLGYVLWMAYVQPSDATPYSPDQFIGMPAWLTGDDDRYDVDAKVDEADLADWQDPVKQPAMLRSMLQAMLEDRLKLVVHRSTREAPVDLLVVGKRGPKFKETNPDELHPGTRPMPGGGRLSREEEEDQMTVHYFGISIAQLARWVLGDAGRPVEDKTGLAGRYDVTIQRPTLRPSVQQGGVSAPDPGLSAASIADQLGLKLEPSKGQVETLVIDHVEPPSPN
jgi:bla regulator protein blaR1